MRDPSGALRMIHMLGIISRGWKGINWTLGFLADFVLRGRDRVWGSMLAFRLRDEATVFQFAQQKTNRRYGS